MARVLQRICEVCHKGFSRLEHLKRHAAVHDKDKRFKCKHCGKKFARKDAALRHELGHIQTPPSGQTAATSASLCRACSSCTTSQVKCSGGVPCDFCLTRNLDCIYRPRKRKRQRYSVSEATVSNEANGDGSLLPRDPIPVGEQSGESGSHVRPIPNIQLLDDLSINGGGTLQTQGESDGAAASSSLLSRSLSDVAVLDSRPSVRKSGFGQSDVLQHQRMPINWLPFDNASFIPLTSSLQNVEAIHGESALRDTTSQPSNQEVSVQTVAAHAEPTNGSYLPHDQYSALIASMRMGLPGLEADSSYGANEQSQIGKLYFDGSGARSSQSDRRTNHRRSSYVFPGAARNDAAWTSATRWPDLLQERVQSDAHNSHLQFNVPDEVYYELVAKLSSYHTSNPYKNQYWGYKALLMARQTWNFFIKLYFENFHVIYPFLDQSLLGLPAWGWALCLATAAIGTRYADSSELIAYGEYLSRVLHEMLLQELDCGYVEDSLPYIQARALCAVSLCQSRQHSLIDCGNTALTMMCNSCLRLRLLEEDHRIGELEPGQDPDQAWIAWRFRESRRRTGFFIWIVDSSMAFIRGVPPQLPMKRLVLLLPSEERLWQADTARQWLTALHKDRYSSNDPAQFHIEEKSRPSTQDSIRLLWTELEAPKTTSAFTTAALIHMLIRRIWDAGRYLDDPIYSWSNRKLSQSRQSLTSEPIARYLGANSEFARWRNGTCDCLDVLHWTALSISAKAGGYESPVFLSLHLSRLLILTPVYDLLGFVHADSAPSSSCLLPHTLYHVVEFDQERRQIIMTWFQQDRHKARLAVIHAGAIFWHVRRYSSESFFEPFSVYLASIVLWAYGVCAQKCLAQTTISTEPIEPVHAEIAVASDLSGMSGTPQDHLYDQNASVQMPESLTTPSMAAGHSLDPRMPSQMQLDRPVDDELVQYFIRSGDMRLSLEGVHDLCSARGPSQVLREAITILNESGNVWTITERYAKCLGEAATAVF